MSLSELFELFGHNLPRRKKYRQSYTAEVALVWQESRPTCAYSQWYDGDAEGIMSPRIRIQFDLGAFAEDLREIEKRAQSFMRAASYGRGNAPLFPSPDAANLG